MLAIEITPDTVRLIAELNNGVIPKVEDEPTWFIFDPNAPAKIISDEESIDKYYSVNTTTNATIHVVKAR